ncbi:3'-to-5' exoribonuclease RNase R [Myxococcus hansupus]|uniref:3'-to-5' exoribonuclease RNase R n=1 Tax=Pseudomyxococcus hansupus TaxID=1297742 RepID=A0A0H4WUP6_9BACT|nr:zf-HC2 domain-containing protein [Myxococcus hansupus]AKQ65323.1 3'-to-5' exoribonuclease RNase R [Myxococcus hansupus]
MNPQNAHAHEDRLLDFAYGELPVPEARLVEAHLEGCARCSQALDEIRGVRATMSQLSVESAPDAGLESLMAYAQQAARRAAAGPEPKPSRWRRWLLPVVGLASVSTLGIVTFQARSPELTQPDLRAAEVQSPWAAKDSAPAPAAPVAPAPTAAAPAPVPPPSGVKVPAELMASAPEWDGDKAQKPSGPSKNARMADLGGQERLRADDWANAGSGGGLGKRGSQESASKSKYAPSTSARARAEAPAPAPASKLALSEGAAHDDEESLVMAERRVPDSQAPMNVPPRDSLRVGMSRAEKKTAAADDFADRDAPAAMAKAEAEVAPPPPPKGQPLGEPAPGAPSEVAAIGSPQGASAPVMRKEQSVPAQSAARPSKASVTVLSQEARVASQAGDRSQEAGLIRAALAAGASGSERLDLLNRLCEAEFALGMYSAGVETCNLVIHEAPGSSAASAARRRLTRESERRLAPTERGNPPK